MFNFSGEIVFGLVPIILALVIFFTTEKPWLGIMVSLVLIFGCTPIAAIFGKIGNMRGYDAMILIPLIQSVGSFGLILSLNRIWPHRK